VVSNLSVYRKNDITLAPESLPDDVELDINTRTVTPTRGAIVVADYKAKVGRRVLFNLVHNGQFVPFGAMASLKGADNSSVIVGDKGQAYLTGLDSQGTVLVTWGAESDRQCRAPSYFLRIRRRVELPKLTSRVFRIYKMRLINMIFLLCIAAGWNSAHAGTCTTITPQESTLSIGTITVQRDVAVGTVLFSRNASITSAYLTGCVNPLMLGFSMRYLNATPSTLVIMFMTQM
jgi:hypothetical protein